MRTTMFLIASVAIAVLCGAAAASAQDQAPVEDAPQIHIEWPPEARPTALMPLYVGAVALEAYDGYSTIHGVSRGSVEANPLIEPVADHPVAIWTIKAAATATTIYLIERDWRRGHRKRAVALMIIADGVLAAVATHNVAIISTK